MTAAAVASGRILTVMFVAHDARRFFGKREQRIMLCATDCPARMFAEKENYKGEDEAETDRESKRDDGHK